MQRYLLRRLALAVPTIFGITVLIFIAMRVLPGDPLAQIASEGQGQYRLSDQELADARASLGLDRPLPEQYLKWIADVGWLRDEAVSDPAYKGTSWNVALCERHYQQLLDSGRITGTARPA